MDHRGSGATPWGKILATKALYFSPLSSYALDHIWEKNSVVWFEMMASGVLYYHLLPVSNYRIEVSILGAFAGVHMSTPRVPVIVLAANKASF